MNDLKKQFETMSSFLFKHLDEGESLGINLSAEQSSFIRFNHSKIRQRTEVEQCHIDMDLIKSCPETKGLKGASLSFSFSSSTTEEQLHLYLQHLQKEVEQLPVDPYTVAHEAGEKSSEENKGELPPINEILDFFKEELSGVDLAGQLVSGTSFRANTNSLGQMHWFSSESMYLDYSLYSAKEKVVKGSYASTHYNKQVLAQSIHDAKEALKVMDAPTTELSPGKYKVYLAPAAVNEIADILGWHALSGSAYKQGDCPLGEAFEGKKNLSPLFNMNEDFSLGLSPRFNELGELAAEKMSLVKKGKLENLLVSKSCELEFGLKSNQASGSEAPRSLVIETGELKREEILEKLDTGIYLSNLHYLNWSDKQKGRITGMTRFGCLWVENGKIVGPIKDMRFDETLYQIFGDGLRAITEFSEVSMATGSYSQRDIGGVKLPGLLVEGFTFTL
ncbi:MAG: Zn-dependent protease [Halobacteriovoraceae bacterium]|nr:Zn-dependent protease [Halobacteriovoraceae bacterium]